jgi:hypothetical protein
MCLGKDEAESESGLFIVTGCHLMRASRPWFYRSRGAAYVQRNKTKDIMGDMRDER